MTKSTQSKQHPKTATRSPRADEATETQANQLGATEDQVTPLTPPTRDDASIGARPKAADRKQRAADEVDPADEITPG